MAGTSLKARGRPVLPAVMGRSRLYTWPRPKFFAHIPFNACLKRVGDARQVPAESARSLHHSRKGLAVHIEQGIVDHREVTHCMAAGRGRHRHGIKTARRHSFFLMQMVGCVFHSGSQLKRLEEALQRSAHYQGIVPAQGVAVGGVIVDSTVYGEVGVVFCRARRCRYNLASWPRW